VVQTELCVEEIRLCGDGLLGVSSVLATQVPTMLAASVPSRSSAPPLMATPSDGVGRSPSGGGSRPSRGAGRSRRPHIYCGYCQKSGHPKTDCYKKMLDMGLSSTRTRPPPLSPFFSVRDIVMLKSMIHCKRIYNF
jgi:hypothetical protein